MERLRTIWYRHRLAVVTGSIGLVILGGWLAPSLERFAAPAPTSAEAVPAEIVVDVEGAVVTQGLQRLPAGSLVDDAIAAAGGTTDQADLDRLAKELNRADSLKDHQKVYVPFQNEQAASGEAADSTVNLNSASQDELESLPGVGPATAEKIIEYRQANPFTAIEELMDIPGIGEAKFDKLKEKVSV